MLEVLGLRMNPQRPTATATQAGISQRCRPSLAQPAVAHAQALVDSYGVKMACEIARTNAAVAAGNDYWHKVLFALAKR
jgi:hypothetical protein